MKSKVGRPKKINYNPKITVHFDENTKYTDILEIKYNLGMFLTIGELEALINDKISDSDINIKLQMHVEQPVVKVAWYKKILNWIRGKRA